MRDRDRVRARVGDRVRARVRVRVRVGVRVRVRQRPPALHVDGHGGGDQAEHLVGLHLDDVIGGDEDLAAHLVRAAHRVARVERALLRRRARLDLVRLDALGSHGLQQG